MVCDEGWCIPMEIQRFSHPTFVCMLRKRKNRRRVFDVDFALKRLFI